MTNKNPMVLGEWDGKNIKNTDLNIGKTDYLLAYMKDNLIMAFFMDMAEWYILMDLIIKDILKMGFKMVGVNTCLKDLILIVVIILQKCIMNIITIVNSKKLIKYKIRFILKNKRYGCRIVYIMVMIRSNKQIY